jgi:hypothetical protein
MPVTITIPFLTLSKEEAYSEGVRSTLVDGDYLPQQLSTGCAGAQEPEQNGFSGVQFCLLELFGIKLPRNSAFYRSALGALWTISDLMRTRRQRMTSPPKTA